MTKLLLLVHFVGIFALTLSHQLDEKEEKLPTKCHVCKHMTRELSEELGRTDKSRDVLQLGQVFQKEPKKIPYRHSELRLTEALENACSNVLEYKVHKDKPLALRYEKVESATFKTLKGLKKRGVKVDLGFPDQMWDTPDAEVTRLKSKCEQMVERYEDDISHWYWHLTDANLTQWLCVDKILKPGEDDCLNETASRNKEIAEKKQEKEINSAKEKENKKNKKKKTKSTELNDRLNEQRDKEKIERLIRQQAEEQSRRPRFSSDRYRRNDEWRRPGGMSQSKQRVLRDRLRAINDPDRLRREIRKIRNKELKEEEYYPMEPWERNIDSDIPEDVRRDMRGRAYDRFDDADDFQREIEMRAMDLESSVDELDSFAIHEMLRFYMDDARQIRDKNELLKRLKDLDALSAIVGNRHSMHDEL